MARGCQDFMVDQVNDYQSMYWDNTLPLYRFVGITNKMADKIVRLEQEDKSHTSDVSETGMRGREEYTFSQT